MKKHSQVVYLVIALIVLLVIAGLLYAHARNAAQAPLSHLAASPLVNVSGAITATSSDSVTLSMYVPNKPARVVTASFNANTPVYREVFKDPAQFAREQAAYQASASSTPPLPYTPQTMQLSDLSIGMFVIVTVAPGAAPNANSVRATSIGVLP